MSLFFVCAGRAWCRRSYTPSSPRVQAVRSHVRSLRQVSLCLFGRACVHSTHRRKAACTCHMTTKGCMNISDDDKSAAIVTAEQRNRHSSLRGAIIAAGQGHRRLNLRGGAMAAECAKFTQACLACARICNTYTTAEYARLFCVWVCVFTQVCLAYLASARILENARALAVTYIHLWMYGCKSPHRCMHVCPPTDVRM